MKIRHNIDIQMLSGIAVCTLFTAAFIYGLVSHHATSTAMVIFPLLACFTLSMIVLPSWIKFFNELKAPWMSADGYLSYAVNSRPYKSVYRYVLNYCKQTGQDQYVFYKIVKTPIFNRFFKRAYLLQSGTTTRIASPSWMDSINTIFELQFPTPNNIPAHPYLSYDIITEFSHDSVCVMVGTKKLFDSPVPRFTTGIHERYIYFNSEKGWRRISEDEIERELSKSSDLVKMEWNIYQLCH